MKLLLATVVSSSPAHPKEEEKLTRYRDSWADLMSSVRQGTSWSGNERNRCLLNLAGKQFADASALSGLDFNDDGRALAVCDWNRDGKLDLWLRNRSAPRLRLMLNQSESQTSLSLRLQGVTCNRDAIGAIVEMKHGDKPLLRSLRAGEMFLSQSSKWLHFGLGNQKLLGEATVFWPGGKKEVFRGLEAGGRYLLKQGSGTAQTIDGPPSIKMENSPRSESVKTKGPANIRLPIALPLPQLTYRDTTAQPQRLQATGRPRLLMIWESSCPSCTHDLRLLEAQKKKLSEASIELLALALAADDLKNSASVYQTIDQTKFSSPWGIADPNSLLNLWRWQAAWFDRRPPASVPFACLVDEKGNCLSLYRDGIPIDTILKDARELTGIDPRTRWHLAPPLSGTWFTNPLNRNYIWSTIGAQMRSESQKGN